MSPHVAKRSGALNVAFFKLSRMQGVRNSFNSALDLNIRTWARIASTQSVTAGQTEPRCRASAARASRSGGARPARRAAAPRTAPTRPAQRSRSQATGAPGLCASAACNSPAVKPSRSASVSKRASSSPRSVSRLADARASADTARPPLHLSGDPAYQSHEFKTVFSSRLL